MKVLEKGTVRTSEKAGCEIPRREIRGQAFLTVVFLRKEGIVLEGEVLFEENVPPLVFDL